MKEPGEPLFLADEGYRRRRATDAVRLLPFLGLLLWLVFPLLRDPATTPENETAGAVLYVFGVWIGLIICAASLSRPLREPPDDVDDQSAPETQP
ncbi:hypothetical protein [Aliiroseovarius sp. YM-037]|uniref:hypothetical protein n=1 Tax=Aliiroseovarius sp. YM-037 TaxID=3341728 RepID=UPI003A7F9890